MLPALIRCTDGQLALAQDINSLRMVILQAYDIRHLYAANNVDHPTTQIDVAVDLAALVQAGGPRTVIQAGTPPAVNLTLNTTAVGINGLDQGELAAGGYYIHLVAKDEDEDALVGDFGLVASTSLTAPAVPAGYTHRRTITWFYAYTDADDGITKVALFQHVEDQWIYLESQNLLSVTASDQLVWNRTALSVDGLIPSWADEGIFEVGVITNAAPNTINLYDADSTEPALLVSGSSGDSDSECGWVVVCDGEVYYDASLAAAGCMFWINCHGFKFPLWREI